jgi:hypothetical protein
MQPLANNIETTPISAARSAAAERMRLHRERRRQGLRCLMIELRETEIDALIRRGLLNNETRNDPGAVSEALYAFFDSTLGAAPRRATRLRSKIARARPRDASSIARARRATNITLNVTRSAR